MGPRRRNMDPRWFVKPGEKLPEKIEFPTPTMPREVQQEQFLRDLEIDPKLYYPPDAYRKPVQKWPGVTLNPREMLKAHGIKVDDDDRLYTTTRGRQPYRLPATFPHRGHV